MNRAYALICAVLIVSILIVTLVTAPFSTEAAMGWVEPDRDSSLVQMKEPDKPLASVGAAPHNFLAIGVPYEDVTYQDAGAVNVIYDAGGGLSADGDQIWYEGHNGMLGSPEENDLFGKSLAVGDFDGDGNLDLVIGVPYEDYNIIEDAGIVHVLYGASGTLTTTTTEIWHQASTGIVGSSTEAYDQFGSALAIGDFDGDDYDDLAVGAPGQQIGDDDNAGVVNVIYGSATGLTAVGNQVWRQGADGIIGSAEADDWFGYSLTSADFDGDGYDDLAVGVPYEDHNSATTTIEDMGGVNIIYGSASGLTGADTWWIAQNLADIADTGETDDLFGWALAVGDFNRDHYADLAVGVPYEDLGNVNDTGSVNIIFGSADGLTVAGNIDRSQGSFGVQDTCETLDRFGYALTAGDFDGDGHDDLVVGVPYETIDTLTSAGSVHVLYGRDNGLALSGNLLLQQDNPDISNTAEIGDRFGMALATGNFNGDVYTDLAIGVPGEDMAIFMNTYVDAGAVHVIHGSDTGLTFDDDQFWSRNSTSIEGALGNDDEFGRTLAAYYRLKTHAVYLPLVQRN
ncbi:MAG: FG-GAP repeat protein [Anaerolineae bacterium]|nr:FG-GAP repeat protein [Anaerolineae bacterium]